MKNTKFSILILMVLMLVACKSNKSDVKTIAKTDANGFSYEEITNDPTGLRLYTLDNGLTVYLSQNDDEPKIQTYIAVRAGSNYDPKESTGLAHYLEHMVFKGTDEIGTQDWEKEKAQLDVIAGLYEEHRKETDADKKLEIYRKIDSVSLVASNHSIANEYDKMLSSLGATGTNAWTWFEETVYTNKIPANELDKWLTVESERFSQVVLRLFHTELEAVFEEFNRGQDNDFRKRYAAMLEGLFPNHPYGQQTTIGIAEHLKNPSMIDINNYFDKYYVPNNMAVVLVGDFEYEETIQKVADAFGSFEGDPVEHPVLPTEEPITAPVVKEVFGPTAENVSVAYRAAAKGTKEHKLLTLADMIMANGNAGIIDLNLNQKQVVQNASCSPTFRKDYSWHQFTGTPKADQSLEEVKDLLLAQVDSLKQGKFEDWMIDAVINDLELNQTRQYESSTALANAYVAAFITEQSWEDEVKFLNELRQISKDELVAFANEFYGENYVITYKRQGEDANIVKVSNPGITPVNLNRGVQSEWVQNFNKIEAQPLAPKFIDYKSEIKSFTTDSGINVAHINNDKNELFDLNIIFDMGSDNDKQLSIAAGYMEYLGTDKYSPEELKKEFYKLGVNYYVNTGGDRTYVGLNGLKGNLDKGLELLEHLWSNAVADEEAYNKYVEKIAKGRQDNKTQKGSILWNGLFNYGKFGENSRLRNIIQVSDLQGLSPQDLVDLVKDMRNYKQRIFYYGKDADAAVAALNTHHTLGSDLAEYPEAMAFAEKETGGNVYYVDYDMVQSEMVFLAKAKPFAPENLAASNLFNTYFGSGLSSIVFQEIRESKSLAYSAFSQYATPSKKEDSHYIYAYIGTQANKMPEAVEAMMDLMTDMPEAEEQFNAAKEAALKKLAAQRITKQNIFWSYERLKRLGIDNDNREEIYNTIKDMTMADLRNFFNENIKGENYNILVIGNKNDIDFQALSKLGVVQEMDIDHLFNYEKPEEVKM